MHVHADYVWHAAHDETRLVTRNGTTGNAVRACRLRNLVSRVDLSEHVLYRIRARTGTRDAEALRRRELDAPKRIARTGAK